MDRRRFLQMLGAAPTVPITMKVSSVMGRDMCSTSTGRDRVWDSNNEPHAVAPGGVLYQRREGARY